jgi:DnaD/phage-associated family protein
MDKFDGFPPGKERLTRIPLTFFKDLLPKIDDLSELKVTLYTFWMLDRMEGDVRYFQAKDILNDEIFCAGMGKNQKESKKNIQSGLDLAVRRGTFLAGEVKLLEGNTVLFFLNTPRGKAAIQAINHGNWEMSDETQSPINLDLDTPNIFRLYEEHIGPLTPIISETLMEAENTFPKIWINDAFQIAVENNVRKWRYIEAILINWQEEGRDDRTDQKDPEEDRKRYIEGDYADFINH